MTRAKVGLSRKRLYERGTNRFAQPRPQVRRRSLGFTLIELLVVISIIALIVALLLPVLSKARDASKNVTCMSTERQLGILHAVYATEHDGRIAPLMYKASASAKYPSRYGTGNKNAVSGDVYGLPSSNPARYLGFLAIYGLESYLSQNGSAPGEGAISCPIYTKDYGAKYGSYAPNMAIGELWYEQEYHDKGMRFANYSSMSELVLMGENPTIELRGYNIVRLGLNNQYQLPTPHFATYAGQNRWVYGSANFLFCDGHVASVDYASGELTDAKNFNVLGRNFSKGKE